MPTTFAGRTLIADKCSSCPCTLPYCAGQYDPNLCADVNAQGDYAQDTGQQQARFEQGKAVSSSVTGWPAA